ncbi:hypothetical protein Taro_051681 [Colocasia esculenta]|uniref:HSF-type DNA-binding domain-containing protein n=1 Tax=Colocasia esculenta TaxID=4460 RepID=A0A843XH75_COLES|nr:hypothetical protein [Colocasia esculenta]
MALAAAAGALPLGACGGGGGGGAEGGGGCAGAAATALELEPHKVVPAPFLTKTYQLVDDPATDSIVSWGDDHSTFVVWRPPEFARDVLPNYFKHNNFSSFVRQLNTYGFRKIVPERWEFANEFFRKGEKHLLCEIHRRKTSSVSPLPLPNPHHLHLPFHPYHNRAANGVASAASYFVGSFPGADDMVTSAAWCDSSSSSGAATTGSAATSSALVEENQKLRRANAALLSELAHMRELYNDIIYFVQNHVRPVAPSSAFPSSLLLSPPASHQHHDHPPSTAAKVPGAPMVRRLSGFHPWQQQVINRSSATSSSSVTIAEEPSPNNNSSNGDSADDDYFEDDSEHNKGSINGGARPKLFGVSLTRVSSDSKRLLHRDELDVPPPPPPAAKPRFHHPNEELGLNLGPPFSFLAAEAATS